MEGGKKEKLAVFFLSLSLSLSVLFFCFGDRVSLGLKLSPSASAP
jgi:hypothetical protein